MASSAVGLDQTTWALVGVIAVVVILLFSLSRYLRRQGGELALREPRSVLADRSFNQIRIGRAAADGLERSGTDVTRARALLDRADASRTRRDFAGSIELSKRAQEILTEDHGARRARPLATHPRVPSAPRLGGETVVARTGAEGLPPKQSLREDGGPVAVQPTSSEAPRSVEAERLLAVAQRPPKNQLEARFEQNLLAEEIVRRRAGRAKDPVARTAERLGRDSQAAYDRNDYTEALRLALKGRRSLGVKIEGLPASGAGRIEASGAREGSGLPVGGLVTPGPEPGFGAKCPQCGRIGGAADRFCRDCGTTLAPAVCGRCNQPLLAGDRFCGTCGAPAE